MPGTTPNFGIPYPCAGEVIDPGVFEDFADGVESALAQVDAASLAAVQRPRGQKLLDGSGQSVATTVLSTLTYSSTVYASGITDTATGFTITSAGVYMVTLETLNYSSVVTCDYWSAQILNTATVVYRRKLFDSTELFTHRINIGGLVVCNVADTLSAQWQWQGTGGPMFILSRFSAAKVCDL